MEQEKKELSEEEKKKIAETKFSAIYAIWKKLKEEP